MTIVIRMKGASIKKWIWVIVILVSIIVIGVLISGTKNNDNGYDDEKDANNVIENDLPIISPGTLEDDQPQTQSETDSNQNEDVDKTDGNTKNEKDVKTEKNQGDSNDKVEQPESDDVSEIELPFISVP